MTGAYGAAVLAMEEMGETVSTFKGFDVTLQKAPEKNAEITAEPIASTHYDENVNKIVFNDYVLENSSKKVVGIPRALFTYGMFSMFYTFFKNLGMDVMLSDPTDENTLALGQKYAMDETCFPIKLITGHVAELMLKKVDYIFFPDLVTVDHPGSQSRKNYGCAFMQLSFKVMNRAMELDKKVLNYCLQRWPFIWEKNPL